MSSDSFQGSGATEGGTSPISEAEFQALVDMVGADMPEVLLDLLETYLEESAGLVSAIRAGVQDGDFQAILRPAHSLKSSSASIGAMRLSKLCADLEAHLRGSLPGLDVPNQVQSIEQEFGRVQVALSARKANFSS